MRSKLIHFSLTIFFLFSLGQRAYASELFPVQVDIRDITKQHILDIDIDSQVYLDPAMHDHYEFNCALLTDTFKNTFCKLNNKFLYDNYDSYPINESKLLDFRPHQNSEELFYNLYGANKFYNLERNANITTSIVLKNINQNFNEFNLVAIIYFDSEVYFQEFTVSFINNSFETTAVSEPVLLAGNFKVHAEVGLLTASLLLSVNINDFNFKKIMPIAVPGFNYEKTKLKSLSINKTHYLSNGAKLQGTHNASFKQRFDPDYYNGLPFLKILNKNNSYFAYGFHGTLFSRPLERGFLSTGCYRMKPKDIIEFYYIFTKLTINRATTVTKMYLSKNLTHPMPMIKKVYSKAKYSGSQKGPDGLTVMERVYGEEIPINNLINF